MTRIITITSNDPGISWGPAVHFLELWNELSGILTGWSITGIAPSWTRRRPIIEPDFRLRSILVPDIRGLRQLIYDLVVALYLVRNRNSYDLVYLRLSHWHLLAIVSLRILRKSFVLELNGLSKEDSDSAAKSKVTKAIIGFQERWLVNNAVASIAVSDGIAAALFQRYAPGRRVHVITNGVATRFFSRPREQALGGQGLRICYVGTFTPWDGARDVIDLASKFPEVEFFMVGDGADRKRIEAGASRNVTFVGKVEYSALPDLYASMDAGIVLYEFSRHQNVKLSSLKTLEYVASRLPVFTTAVPGQEFVAEAGFGILVGEFEDRARTFRSFLGNLHSFHTNYEAVADELPGKFGWKRTAMETADVLHAVAGKPSDSNDTC